MGIYDDLNSFRDRVSQLEANPHQGKDDLPATFFESFSNALDLTYTRFTPTGRQSNYDTFIDEQKALYLREGISLAPVYTRYNHMLVGLNIDREVDWAETIKANTDIIEKLKRERPELELLSWDDIQSRVTEQQQVLLDEDERLTRNSTGLSKAGWLLGVIAGTVRDPINAASMLLPLGQVKAGASLASNALRIGSLEVLMSASLEALQKPDEVQFREDTGEEVTTGEAATEVAVAGAFGGAVGAVGGAVLPSLLSLVKQYKDVIKNTRNVPPKDTMYTADIMDEASQILKDRSPDIDEDIHMEAYVKAREDIQSGQEVSVNEILGVTEPSLDDIAKSARVSTEEEIVESASVTPVTQLQERINAGESLGYIDVSDADSPIFRSINDDFNKLSSETKELNTLTNCLSGGSSAAI